MKTTSKYKNLILGFFLTAFIAFFPIGAQADKTMKNGLPNPCEEFVKTWDAQKLEGRMKFLKEKDAEELNNKKYLENRKNDNSENYDSIAFLFENRSKLFYKIHEKASKGDEKAISILIWMEPLIWNAAHPSEELTGFYGNCMIANPKAYLSSLKAILETFPKYDPDIVYVTDDVYVWGSEKTAKERQNKKIAAIKSVLDPDLKDIRKKVLKELTLVLGK